MTVTPGGTVGFRLGKTVAGPRPDARVVCPVITLPPRRARPPGADPPTPPLSVHALGVATVAVRGAADAVGQWPTQPTVPRHISSDEPSPQVT